MRLQPISKTSTNSDTNFLCAYCLYSTRHLDFQHNTAFGLDDVHNHAHQRFGREENAVIRGHRRGKLVEKVLINAPDDVVLNVVQGAVVEDAQRVRS